MNELSLPTSTEAAIRRVEELGEALKQNFPEYVFPVEHSLHGGMYARTIRMPAGTAAVGTLIRVPTLLIVAGTCALTQEIASTSLRATTS